MAKKNETAPKLYFIVDAGKYDTKVLVINALGQVLYHTTFPTLVEPVSDFTCMDVRPDDRGLFNVVYNQELYQVGKVPDAQPDLEPGKNTKTHQLCVYAALADALTMLGLPNGSSIDLTVGYPTGDFTDEEVERFKSRLMGEDKGEIQLMVNDKPCEFHLNSVAVSAEGSCLIPMNLHADIFANITYAIDLGGYNANYRGFNQSGSGIAIPGSLDEAGIHYLRTAVKEEVKKLLKSAYIDKDAIDYNLLIAKQEIPELREKDAHLLPAVREAVTRLVNHHIEKEIIRPLKAIKYNLMSPAAALIFTGGGSLLLRPYLEAIFEDKADALFFSETGRWDNVLAYGLQLLVQMANEEGLSDEEYNELMQSYFEQINKIDWTQDWALFVA